jgi:hypothetical protein
MPGASTFSESFYSFIHTFFHPSAAPLHRIEIGVLLRISFKKVNFIKELKFKISQGDPIHPT